MCFLLLVSVVKCLHFYSSIQVELKFGVRQFSSLMVHTVTQDDQTVPPVEGGRRERGGRRQEGGEQGDNMLKYNRASHECVYLLLVLLYKTVVTMAVLELGEVAASDLHRPQHCH